MNPTFAELVVYYLSEDEQKPRFSDPNDPPGSKISVLDTYHYQQLLACEDIDLDQLEVAWKTWKQLGQYEHGELFRQTLYNTTKGLNRCLKLYREIKRGLWEGTLREQVVFELQWEKKGLREAKSDKDWVMWKEVKEMTRDFDEPVGCMRIDCYHKNLDECLGVRCYR